MIYIHSVHEEFFHRIWLIAGPAPFVSGMLTDSDSAKYIGGKLNSFCRDRQFLEIVDTIHTSNRVKVYRLSQSVVEWCESRFGPAHPLADSYSENYLDSYRRRTTHWMRTTRRKAI